MRHLDKFLDSSVNMLGFLCDILKKNSQFFVSKRSRASWEYRMDHTDHHSSGESKQILKFFQVLSALGGHLYEIVSSWYAFYAKFSTFSDFEKKNKFFFKKTPFSTKNCVRFWKIFIRFYAVIPLIRLCNRYISDRRKCIYRFLLTNIDELWFVLNVWTELEHC